MQAKISLNQKTRARSVVRCYVPEKWNGPVERRFYELWLLILIKLDIRSRNTEKERNTTGWSVKVKTLLFGVQVPIFLWLVIWNSVFFFIYFYFCNVQTFGIFCIQKARDTVRFQSWYSSRGGLILKYCLSRHSYLSRLVNHPNKTGTAVLKIYIGCDRSCHILCT